VALAAVTIATRFVPTADTAANGVQAPLAEASAIAVLPFANPSGDAQQTFFSDGVTEELTAALARVPGCAS
jgi:TolB-like protein